MLELLECDSGDKCISLNLFNFTIITQFTRVLESRTVSTLSDWTVGAIYFKSPTVQSDLKLIVRDPSLPRDQCGLRLRVLRHKTKILK